MPLAIMLIKSSHAHNNKSTVPTSQESKTESVGALFHQIYCFIPFLRVIVGFCLEELGNLYLMAVEVLSWLQR